MTPNIEQQLQATGIARVIVVLEGAHQVPSAALSSDRRSAGPSPEELAAHLEGHFVHSENSQDAALARSLARRVLRQQGRAPSQVAALENTAELARLVPSLPVPPKMRLYSNLGIMLGTTDRKGVAALLRDRHVHRVTGAPPIQIIRPVRSEPVQLAGGVTWGLERLRIPEVWDAGYRGAGVLVGHLDTGLDGTHPALQEAIAKFMEFNLMGEQVPGTQPHDTNSHGTHTAGTIIGRKVSATAFGVAPEAQLASGLVIEGGDVIARIIGGLDWLVGLQQVRVLSMSLGLPGYHEDFLPVFQILRAKGILPVIAVGNDYAGTSRSPGNYVESLSVGACDQNDLVADFSSSQRFQRADHALVPDLVAPGVGVISCVPGGGYASKDGTSMATPHVAGLAALLFQAKTTATVDEVEQAIFGSCTLPPGIAEERGNRGIPDGVQALKILLGQAPAVSCTAQPPRAEARPSRKVGKKSTGRRRTPKTVKGHPHGTGKGRSRTSASTGHRRRSR
jgi:subtilisin family serine protease